LSLSIRLSLVPASRCCLFGLLASVLFATDLPAANEGGRLLYRYRNEQGVMVLSEQIPPEQVGQEYSVLTPSGRVIKVVPKTLSKEEAERRQVELEQQKQQQEYDRSLLNRYSSVRDIEAARQRKVTEIDARQALESHNRTALQRELDRQLSQAAQLELNGQPVSQLARDNIDNIRLQLSEIDRKIEFLRNESQRVRSDFDRDIARFQQLTRKSGEGEHPNPGTDRSP
jgi:hypothetical protein